MPRKSGTGCITCRIRRVKCDETKPACQRCLNAKRQCDGYLPDDSTVTRRQLADAVRQLSVVGPVSRALAQYPQHNSASASPSNLTLFDVFRKLTAPSTASFMPSNFWTGELLQLAHAEPAVWHATLALGALHQKHEVTTQGSGDDPKVEVYSKLANQHYGQAVTYARDLKNPHKLLSLSLALVSVTNMLGRWGESRVHIMAGHKLLDQTRGHPATKIAAEMLTRLDLQAMTFSESSAPYPYENTPKMTDVVECMRQTPVIESYGQAGTALFTLVRRVMTDGEIPVSDEESCEKFPMESVMRDLVAWEYKMAQFERNRWTGEPGAISTRLYHTLLRMILAASMFGPEMRWDGLLGYFERIVSLVEALRLATATPTPRSPLSLEPGIIIPLFITVARCRHPILRSRAVNLLRTIKRQEGMWLSDGTAAVATKIMSVEGQVVLDPSICGSSLPQLSQDIPWEVWATGTARLHTELSWEGAERVPEAQRIRETLVMVQTEQRRIDLTFIMCSGDEAGTYGSTRAEVATY